MSDKDQREAGMCAVTGIQGVGKTYLNMYVIKDYVKDKFYNKVKGRKCLIMDTNGEYTQSQFSFYIVNVVCLIVHTYPTSVLPYSRLNRSC